jgi:flagellar hook assembly protein FlgD
VPNPLRSGTEIAYDVPVDGARVRLTVFDVAGRRVRILADGPQTAGSRSAAWDGRDDRGNAVGSGVYYCRLEAPGYEQSIKITVLR